jgi:hypothetical protein
LRGKTTSNQSFQSSPHFVSQHQFLKTTEWDQLPPAELPGHPNCLPGHLSTLWWDEEMRRSIIDRYEAGWAIGKQAVRLLLGPRGMAFPNAFHAKPLISTQCYPLQLQISFQL